MNQRVKIASIENTHINFFNKTHALMNQRVKTASIENTHINFFNKTNAFMNERVKIGSIREYPDDMQQQQCQNFNLK